MSVESEIENEPDPAVAGPGATLKAQREAAGHSIEQVSTDTRITRSRLVALEADDYDRVGAHTFVVGYIRKYAKWLGSDADSLIRAFEARVGQTVYTDTGQHGADGMGSAGTQSEEQPEEIRPSTAKRLPLLWIVGGLLVIWILAALWLSGSKPDGQGKPDAVQQPSSVDTRSELPNDESAGAPTIDPDAVAPAQDEALPASPENSEAEVLSSDVPPPKVEPSEAQPFQAPASGGAREARTDISEPIEDPVTEPVAVDTLTMTFSDDCWVEVSDATGNELFAQLQQAGDNLHLSGQAPFEVMLGNARAVTLLVNGQLKNTDPGSNRDTLRLNVGP